MRIKKFLERRSLRSILGEESEAVGSSLEDLLNNVRIAIGKVMEKRDPEFFNTPKGKVVQNLKNELYDIDSKIARIL